MRVVFFASEKPREQDLAAAFAQGCAAHGDKCEIRPNELRMVEGEPFGAAAMVGVKSREIWQRCLARGAMPIMIDKGYTRAKKNGVWEYWRVSVGTHHPTRYFMRRQRSFDRAAALGWEPAPWRKGSYVVLAGSSAKYHGFYDLEGPTEWAEGVVRSIRKHTRRGIVYRPKPSWRDARPITGSRFSYNTQENLDMILAEAHCLVTHGSNACWEAIMSGVPCIVLGDGVAAPISGRDISRVENPPRCPENTRRQWLADLAWCQWTLQEFAAGEAWADMLPLVRGS